MQNKITEFINTRYRLKEYIEKIQCLTMSNPIILFKIPSEYKVAVSVPGNFHDLKMVGIPPSASLKMAKRIDIPKLRVNM